VFLTGTKSARNSVVGYDNTTKTVLSGNRGHGIWSAASNTLIHNTLVGLSAQYTAAANGGNGIQLTADAAYSRIGADSAFHETIISGNALDGILIAAPFVTVLKCFVGVAIAHPGVTARTQAVQ